MMNLGLVPPKDKSQPGRYALWTAALPRQSLWSIVSKTQLTYMGHGRHTFIELAE